MNDAQEIIMKKMSYALDSNSQTTGLCSTNWTQRMGLNLPDLRSSYDKAESNTWCRSMK